MVDCQQNPGTIQEVGLGLTPGLFSMAFQTGGTRPLERQKEKKLYAKQLIIDFWKCGMLENVTD